MNKKIINPVEFVHEYYSADIQSWWKTEIEEIEEYEVLWSLIVDRASGNGNTLVIRRGSGSMAQLIGQGSNAKMIDAADAMSIYCAERISGVFHNMCLTFSKYPEIIDLSDCDTFAKKINKLGKYIKSYEIDVEATFDLVLDMAVKYNLPQKKIPAYLLILCNMEFDMALEMGEWGNLNKETLFSSIRKKWKAHGYDMPTLVFWQLNENDKDDENRAVCSEIDSDNGIIFLRGFSETVLELIMADEYEKILKLDEYEKRAGEANIG